MNNSKIINNVSRSPILFSSIKFRQRRGRLENIKSQDLTLSTFRIRKLNSERNAVAHSGEFKGQTTALAMLNDAREVIQPLVCPYQPGFKLEKIATKNRL